MADTDIWIVRVHDACHQINTMARALSGIAHSVDRVGLTKLADELIGIADALEVHQDDIKKACGEEVHRGARVAQEHTAGLLTLALHGSLKSPVKPSER